MDEQDVVFNKYVQLQLDSGLVPLEPVYYPIIVVDGVNPIAFRSSTKINSIMMGEMKEENYVRVSDNRSVGIELLKHNVQHAIAALKAFDKAHKRCDFISVRYPAGIIEIGNMYEVLKEVLLKNPSVDPSRICVEFTEDLVDKDSEKARLAVLDMKILKLRTALVGVGKEDSKVSKLVTIPVDYAMIDKEATKWAGDRNKPHLFNSLLSYIKAMGVQSIVIGKEEKKKEMRFSDAIGFMFEGIDPISLDEAVALAEEADD